nr:unnamed protein product [Digitaria exilis]
MPLPVVDGDEAESKPARMTMMHHASLPTAAVTGGGGSENGRDHISKLPDEILGSILFLLPLMEACRTTTLSKRWENVFAGSPISLDDEQVVRRRVGRPRRESVLHAERVDVISRILNKHKGQVRRLRLSMTRFQGDGDGQGLATDAFNGRGVEELIVDSTYPIRFFSSPPLRSIQLINCDWLPMGPPVLPPVFAKLKEVSLCAVNFSTAAVYALLEQCVELESLLLSSLYRVQAGIEPADSSSILQVRSQSLRCLFLEVLGLKEVVIVDAPKLERLLGEVLYKHSHCKVTLGNAPKLQIVGFLTMELPQPPVPPEMTGMSLELSRRIHSVKILGLCVNLCEMGQVKRMLQMLSYFPCVETLNIKIFTSPSIIRTLVRHKIPYTTDLLELAGRADCLRERVKTIVVGDLWLHTDTLGLDFAKILLESAKKLQLMKIFHIPVGKRKESRSYRQKLGLKSNPSIKARVVFPRDYISSRQVSDVLMDASSLAIPDPMFYQRTFRSWYIRKEWNCYMQAMEGYMSNNAVKPQNDSSSNLYGHSSSLRIGNRRFTYNELEIITNNFQRVIGQGGFGKVYDGFFEDGTQVAVKLRSHSSNQGDREFLAEARILTRIHHKYLVSMIGYCKDGECMALVYEYMSEGTLQEHIAGKNLTWRQRLRIAQESAQGLEYLHKGCNPVLIHRDVKATNILLNANMEAKIADFGLSKAFNHDNDTHVSTNTLVGTPGYVDAEYQATMQPTTKSDVYSFGVVLLELITGKPSIFRDPEPTSIIYWARQRLARGNIEASAQRPTMTEVVAQLHECLELEEARASGGDANGGYYTGGSSSDPYHSYNAYAGDGQSTTDVSQTSTGFEVEHNFGRVPTMPTGPAAR